MKKLVIILIAVCLVFTGVLGYFMANGEKDDAAAAIPGSDAVPEIPAVNDLDYDAIYALHDPKEVVATINGKDVLWEEYFYNVFSQAQQSYQYFMTMASYGVPMDWSNAANEAGDNFGQYSVYMAEQTILQLASIKGFCEQNNVVLGDDVKESMAQWRKEQIRQICGEDADEADFAEKLEEIYMTPEMFDEMNNLNHLFQQSYIQLYGDNGEKLSDEAVKKFMDENGYIRANHILLSTVDEQNGSDVSADLMSEKKNQAQGIADELRAIEDKDELLERFNELKEDFCEDPGKSVYTDGMTFRPGEMVPEFEQGCLALEDYQVSEPVKSQFGYHVIIRLPLDPDAVVGYTQNGTAVTVRGNAANIELNDRFQEFLNSLKIEYAEGFEAPNLLDFILK